MQCIEVERFNAEFKGCKTFCALIAPIGLLLLHRPTSLYSHTVSEAMEKAGHIRYTSYFVESRVYRAQSHRPCPTLCQRRCPCMVCDGLFPVAGL